MKQLYHPATASTFLHCKEQYRKIVTYIPRKGIAQPQSQCPNSWFCERLIYSHDSSAYMTSPRYINRSQTHECGNWDCGRTCTIPFLGIHKWAFCWCTSIHWPHISIPDLASNIILIGSHNHDEFSFWYCAIDVQIKSNTLYSSMKKTKTTV